MTEGENEPTYTDYKGDPMTLQAAINSGQPFRRNSWQKEFIDDGGQPHQLWWDLTRWLTDKSMWEIIEWQTGDCVSLSVEDILADDWETKASEPITK